MLIAPRKNGFESYLDARPQLCKFFSCVFLASGVGNSRTVLSYSLQNRRPDAFSSSMRYRLFTSMSTFYSSGSSLLNSPFSCIMDMERN